MNFMRDEIKVRRSGSTRGAMLVAAACALASFAARAESPTAAPAASATAPSAAAASSEIAGTPAPDESVRPEHRRAFAVMRRNWWAPALISLGATGLFDTLGVLSARSNNPLVNAAGGVSILVGTAATSTGWFLMTDDETTKQAKSNMIASGVARMSTLAIGWGVGLVQSAQGWGVCDAYADCNESQFQANAAAASARAHRTYWITNDIAFAMSGADIIGQLIYGYLHRDGAPVPAVPIVPAMLPAGDKMAPGLAWSGKF